MSFTGFLESTLEESLKELFPNESTEVLDRIIRIAFCLKAGSITEKLIAAKALLDSAPMIRTETLTDDVSETFEFDVVAGRIGSIATAVDGGTIDAASTISIEYSLVSNPGASDWKVYDNGSFTGAEVNKEIRFVGVLNRVVWTPNAAEDLNVMVAL